MPVYSYSCDKCKLKFELFFSYVKYEEHPQCLHCKSDKHTIRLYVEDALTINTSVKKSDSELKTLGDLANRNRDKLSNDEKLSLQNKHNKYKETSPVINLPKGMSRISKTKKTQWTEKPVKKRRKINEKKSNS